MSIEVETQATITLVDPLKRGSLSLCDHLGTARADGKMFDISLSGLTVIVARRNSGLEVHHAELPLKDLIQAMCKGLIEHADKITDATERETTP